MPSKVNELDLLRNKISLHDARWHENLGRLFKASNGEDQKSKENADQDQELDEAFRGLSDT